MSIFFYGCVTMDGYLADKNHRLDWLHQTGTVEETSYNDFYKHMAITLMGKRTFCELAKSENAANCYPTTKNYVFTHTKLSHKGFIAINSDVITFVKHLDQQQNIWVIGGNTILAPLLNHNMVDYLILQIAPVLLGNGIPLFSQNELLKRFHLDKVAKYGQFAELTYHKLIPSV